MCLRGLNRALECGAILDILRNAKKANKKAALNNGGSLKRSQAFEMALSVGSENMPLEVGLNPEFLEILLR